MYTVFVNGNQGTTGLRIVERLSGREELTLLTLPEADRKSLSACVAMARKADVTFLCLPDDASRELVAALDEREGCVIDTSTAHRTDARFAYGFPELSTQQAMTIARSRRIAVPGCHASGSIALLQPLVDSGLLKSEAPLAITSLTGYSGGGKQMIAEYEQETLPAPMHAPRPYAVRQLHKHLPEIMHACGLSTPPVFQPIVCDFYSGMLVSLALQQSMLTKKGTLAEVSEIYGQFFANSALIHVLEPNMEANIDSVKLEGTDAMEIFVTGNDERMLVYARFDNLGKGASGAAVQCMNLRLGLNATTGLVF